MKRIGFLVVIASIFILSSCNKDDDKKSVSFKKLKIIEVDLPDSFRLGATYEMYVTYVKPNGCTYFQDFNVIQDSVSVRTVTAVGAHYTDEICENDKEIEATDFFRFKVVYNQTYKFRFWKGAGVDGKPEYLEIEIPVKKSGK